MRASPAGEHRSPRVLVTRPAAQQVDFSARLVAAGFEPLPFPCLAIEAVPADLGGRSLERFARAVFTSANAVRFAHSRLPLPWPIPVEAIGPATARALARAGQPTWREPVAPYDSDAWLGDLDHSLADPGTRDGRHAARDAVSPDPRGRVLIVTGIGGRGSLQHGLEHRDLAHESIAVYRRCRPAPTAETCERLLVDARPDIVSITSDEGLRNLVSLAGPARLPRLLGLPLVVNSQRAAALAAAFGFETPVRVARPPGDDGQIAALEQWRDALDET